MLPGVEPLDWAETLTRVQRAGTYWLATASRDGKPHLVPLLAVWVDGTLHFAASDVTRKAKSLAADPRCSVGAEAEGVDVVVEGEAVKVRDEAVLRRAADAYARRYEWDVTVPGHVSVAAEQTAGMEELHCRQRDVARGGDVRSTRPPNPGRW